MTDIEREWLHDDSDARLRWATVASVGEVTLDRLWHAVPSFAPPSEVSLRLLGTHRPRASYTDL